MAIPTNSALPKKQFGSHHVASTKAIWFGPGSSITISSTAILFTIGSSNPVCPLINLNLGLHMAGGQFAEPPAK